MINNTQTSIDPSNLKIGFASDIHTEFHTSTDWLPPLNNAWDVLILAGDISVGDDVIDTLKRIQDQLPDTEIIFVAGNHEFYYQEIHSQIMRYRERLAEEEHLHFLQNDRVDMGGMTFIGCTLWTGFNAYPEFDGRTSLRLAERSIADFSLIEVFDGSQNICFSPDHARQMFRTSRTWLEKALTQSDLQNTVVITHFPPHPLLVHGTIPVDFLTNYFIGDCKDLIMRYQPACWVYGHNHWSNYQHIGKTLCVSNQLGYSQEDGLIPSYEADIYLMNGELYINGHAINRT